MAMPVSIATETVRYVFIIFPPVVMVPHRNTEARLAGKSKGTTVHFKRDQWGSKGTSTPRAMGTFREPGTGLAERCDCGADSASGEPLRVAVGEGAGTHF